ncbi:MAG: response regulator, partial [bacterium]
NGDWPPHLHFQIIEDMRVHEGDYPGVCSISERAKYLNNCPNPDLILIDGTLPLLDGYEVTRRIRKLAFRSEVPIVFLSGHAQPSAEAEAFAAGCNDYLVKPYGLVKLGSVLERHLPLGKAT